MPTTLFRAVQKKSFRAGQAEMRRETRRAPANVPYLVDNLWEWMRPEGYPSRRHAAYASPTPELALQGASVTPANRHEFVMTTVEFAGQFVMAQSNKSDARHHEDVKRLPQALIEALGGPQWINAPMAAKAAAAILFAPSLTREEVDTALDQLPDADRVEDALRAASSFWADAQLITGPDVPLTCPAGELFFEAFDGYRLTAAE